MSKKRSWLSLIKRLLFPETNQQHHHHHHHPQKIKRRRWLFGRLLKRTKTLPSLSLSPPTSTQHPQTQSIQIAEEHEDEQKADEKQSSNFEEDDQILKDDIINCDNAQSTEIVTDIEAKDFSTNSENENYGKTLLAAIKIQSVYRGFLARKALRALKGLVRLQAMIRGRAVRRQAMTTLKCLQSIAKIQSQVCARRCQMIHADLQFQDLRLDHPDELQLSKQRRKDDELLTKEEQIDIILRKKEAILRSKRIKAYSFNHRHSADSEDGITQGRLRYWLEQYVSDEVSKKDDKLGGKKNRMRNIEGLNIFDITPVPRRSFHKHKKQNSCGEDGLHSSSPLNLPTYMAATESAKAKTRPLTSPRLRPLHIEAYSDSDSPYKQKLLSPMSSINSEATCSGISKVSNKSSFISSQQKSPSFKGVSGPIRSNKNLK